MKKRNNAKTAKAGLILMLAVLMGIMLAAAGCGKKTAADSEETATQSLPTETVQTEETEEVWTEAEETAPVQAVYTFRNRDLLKSHYKKHGIDMGFDSPEEYLAAANGVIANPDALTKTEKEDGDMVYYVEDTNEFVVLSTDGYIRTYFYPDSGKRYFDRQ
jgi:pyocin large subunit-like protein